MRCARRRSRRGLPPSVSMTLPPRPSAAASTRSATCSTRSSRSSAISASGWLRPASRPTGILRRAQHSARHPARQEHDFLFPAQASMAAGWCCAPIPAPCRSAAWRRWSRRSGSSRRAAPFAATATSPIRRCSIRSRGQSTATSLGHLKWPPEFCKAFFELDQVKMRFRASHFPFTEPSMEVDINCSWEGGQIRIGTGDSHEISDREWCTPMVRAGGLDPDQWQGFAFGMGLDRIAMLKYGSLTFAPSSRPICAGFGIGVPGPRCALARRRADVKFTLGWLKDHLDTTATIGVRDGLIGAGLEVEDISSSAQALAPFTVARVIEARSHPNADRLQVLDVGIDPWPGAGGGGAPNARTGPDRAVRAARHAYSGHRRRSSAGHHSWRRIEWHDVLSASCCCPTIMITDLATDLPIGTPAAEALGLSDPVFHIKVTPNRPDALGVRGIARDLAAAASARSSHFRSRRSRVVLPRRSRCASPSMAIPPCPLFVGRYFRGVSNGPSPDWLAALMAIRPGRSRRWSISPTTSPCVLAAAACLRRRSGARRYSGEAGQAGETIAALMAGPISSIPK